MTRCAKQLAGRVTPDKLGEDLFLRAACVLDQEESVHQSDCNTVGPVPVASGYGPGTLTQSAAHVLIGSKENASASSLLNEKRTVQIDNDLWPLSETKVGVPMTSENVDNTTLGVLRDRTTGLKTCCLTGSTTPVLPQTKNEEVKSTSFTGSGPTRGSDANLCGTQNPHFTISLKTDT